MLWREGLKTHALPSCTGGLFERNGDLLPAIGAAALWKGGEGENPIPRPNKLILGEQL